MLGSAPVLHVCYLFWEVSPLVSNNYEVVYLVQPPLVVDSLTGLQGERELVVDLRVDTDLQVLLGFIGLERLPDAQAAVPVDHLSLAEEESLDWAVITHSALSSASLPAQSCRDCWLSGPCCRGPPAVCRGSRCEGSRWTKSAPGNNLTSEISSSLTYNCCLLYYTGWPTQVVLTTMGMTVKKYSLEFGK